MLTDAKLKRFVSGPKSVKHFDGGGLFLEVPKSGNKRWRLKYRFAGKEKLLAIGVYPTITLKEARNKREAAKKLLAAGTDPATVKREEKRAVRMAMANSFESVAREWAETNKAKWTPRHAGYIMRRLEADILPFGKLQRG